jgi:hypothetical protein
MITASFRPRFASALSLSAALVACASTPASPPNAPDNAAAATAQPSAPPSPSAAPAADATPAPALQQRPLDLTNACPHEIHLYYGEQPGDGKGKAATVAAGAVISVTRNADGTIVVWVTDDRGGALGDVHVTKRMHHVRIDATCMKIDAD